MNSGNPLSQSDYKLQRNIFTMGEIGLPNYIRDLNEKVLVVGFHKILQREHKKLGISQGKAAPQIGMRQSTYSHYLNGTTACSICMLKRFSDFYKKNLFEEVLKGSFVFTARKRRVFLPRKLTAELAYYVGYLQGDGYIGSEGLRVGFADEYSAQIEKVNDLTRKLFGVEGRKIEKLSRKAKKPCPNLEIKSLVLNSFLNVVFGIPKGFKEDLRIPPIILQNKRVLRHYLAGLYDADGTLPKFPQKAKQLFIDVTFKDKEFVEEIKDALLQFDIETLKIYKRKARSPDSDKISITWELRIRRKGLILKFLQEIGFYHSDKARRAKELIEFLGGPVA